VDAEPGGVLYLSEFFGDQVEGITPGIIGKRRRNNMFWDKVSPLYDLFENVYNGKVYTGTGKKVAGNVIHLLPEPEKALHELERIVKPCGKIIIPTYINMSNGTGMAAVKFITFLGADFKKQFDLDSYKKFFEEKGYNGVEYHVVDGHMPCAIAVITKEDKYEK
jgi:hypothetical protein